MVTHLKRRSAQIKKLILRTLTGAPKNLGVDPFPDPGSHFGEPLVAILEFAGSVTLLAVSECPQPPVPLGWYYVGLYM